MEIAGYIAALFIGISLGLIGGGGSILTLPVLVYLFGVSPVTAIAYSLFIVGSTSMVGAALNYRKGLVDTKTAMLFGISSIATVFITRKFLISLIPENLSFGPIHISFATLTMILFAILMLAASFSMINNSGQNSSTAAYNKSPAKLSVYGIAVGLVTGFLGAGGGFLLIPALVLLLHLPMKKAVGTSLLIISLNSIIGFTADIAQRNINWNLLLTITAIAIAGIFLGGMLNKRIEGQQLKKGFGWFVLLMGAYIIIKETLLG